MDPVTAGAAIYAGASLIGGGIGSAVNAKESKANRKEARRQFNIQDEYNKNRMQYTVKDAIKAGVNPVAAIGSGSGHYSPTISAGGTSGSGDIIADSVSKAGRSINDMILEKRDREDREIALESANLDLESKRLQNDILRQQLSMKAQVGDPTFSVDHANPLWRVPMRYSLRNAKPLLRDWILPNGQSVSLIDPDAISDADLTNMEAARALGAAALNPNQSYRRRGKGYGRRLEQAFSFVYPDFRQFYRYLKNFDFY